SGDFDILVAQIDQSQFLGEDETANAVLTIAALADAVEGTAIFPAIASVQPSDSGTAVAKLAVERDIAILRGSGNAMRALSAVSAWKPTQPPAQAAVPPIGLGDLLKPGAMS